MPPPIESNVPERDPFMEGLSFMSLAYHPVAVPQSHETMTSSGSFGESSQNTLCGFSGFALFIARASTTFHHRKTPLSTLWHHERSVFLSRSGMRACKVCLESPTRLTSVG